MQCSLTSWDVTKSKQANTNVSIDRPLLCLAVWFTAVVHKTRIVALWSCINDPENQRTYVNLNETITVFQIKSNQYSFNWQNTTTDTDAKVVYIIPKLLDGRRTK